MDGARDFRLMKREMVDAIVEMGEYNRFSKGLYEWVGFRTKWFEYENVERVAGETKWSFFKLFLYSIEGIVAFSTVTIAANIRHLYGAVGTSLRHAFFQVSSIITTTGYATVDFDQWPGYAKTVLVLLMFVGGCAGSTGGGLKVTRVVTLVKAAFMDMRKMIHPNAVVNVRMEGRAMPEKQVRGVQAYFSVYMLLYAVSWLLLSLNGFDLLSTFTALSASAMRSRSVSFSSTSTRSPCACRALSVP